MSLKSDYAEKFKDPRWQKMRLKVLERDNFACIRCGDKKSTLHVHHKYYQKGKDPWDYDKISLVVLCESCHKGEGIEYRENEQLLKETLYNIGFFANDFERLAHGFNKIKLNPYGPYAYSCAISELFEDSEFMTKLLNKFMKRSRGR